MRISVARFISLPAFALLIRAVPAQAQSGGAAPEAHAPQPGENQLRVADRLDVSFSERFRYETLDNRFRAGDTGSDRPIPQRACIGIDIKKIIDPVRFQFEFENSRNYLDDSGSRVTSQMVDEHGILQLHISPAFPGKPGSFGFEAEPARQFGRVAVFDHFAHMQHLQFGYVFNAPWQPSICGRYDYASGDRDPYARRNDNFDSLFGARRWEYGPTGIYQWTGRSNIDSPALYFGFKPAGNLELLPDIRRQRLAQKRAVWIGGALRDPTGAAGSYVGSSMEWRLRYSFTPYFGPEIGHARFFKGRFAREVPQSPTTKDSNYFFVELELRLDDLIT